MGTPPHDLITPKGPPPDPIPSGVRVHHVGFAGGTDMQSLTTLNKPLDLFPVAVT